MGKFKNRIKKIYAKISPQYRKILALEAAINRTEQNIVTFQARNQNMLWLLMADRSNHLSVEDSQKCFWLNYPKSTGDMRVIQEANLYLIRCLTEICNELGITFWMHGGSLIGALRHQGFIPWDDDVDVGMLRKDLNILVEYLKQSDKFRISMAYHDNHTFSRAYQFKSKDENFCCFIDIFVFDFYSSPSQSFKSDFYSIRGEMVRSFLNMQNKPVPEYIAYRFAKYDPEELPQIADLFDKALQKIKYDVESDYVYYSIENYPFPYPLMKLTDIFPCQVVQFENYHVNIPQNSTYYLRGYGDIWQLPKDVGRASHFYYYAPHIEYLKEYLDSMGECSHYE